MYRLVHFQLHCFHIFNCITGTTTRFISKCTLNDENINIYLYVGLGVAIKTLKFDGHSSKDFAELRRLFCWTGRFCRNLTSIDVQIQGLYEAWFLVINLLSSYGTLNGVWVTLCYPTFLYFLVCFFFFLSLFLYCLYLGILWTNCYGTIP